MTDNTNKGFWEKMARIYTAFMSKNDTAYRQICKLSKKKKRKNTRLSIPFQKLSSACILTV